MIKKFNYLKYIRASWVLLVIGMIGAGIQSSFLPDYFPHIDKLCHFLAYGILSFLLPFLFQGLNLRIGLCILLIIAFGSELLQIYIPTRSASFLDLLANLAGFCCGLWTAKIIAHQTA